MDGTPLVPRVEPERRGWPSVPFVAVVEAYVLRSLRDLGLTKHKIRAAAAEVRKSFDTPYALAMKKITTDGVDIFVHYADDGFAGRLQLRQYPDIAPVVIDPRFGWGAPVVESIKVPVDAVVDLWRAGGSLEDVAYEYGMTREQVEAGCRVALGWTAWP